MEEAPAVCTPKKRTPVKKQASVWHQATLEEQASSLEAKLKEHGRQLQEQVNSLKVELQLQREVLDLLLQEDSTELTDNEEYLS